MISISKIPSNEYHCKTLLSISWSIPINACPLSIHESIFPGTVEAASFALQNSIRHSQGFICRFGLSCGAVAIGFGFDFG